MAGADRFLGLLAAGPSDKRCVFNPWADHDERDRAPRAGTPRVRLDNMAAYLEGRRTRARFMLLGEAPSHRGCRFTGIAFCSEVELTHKRDLVAHRPLELTSAQSQVKPMRERSAAIIWDELERGGWARDVVLWNAFPWHPYRAPGGDASDGPCGPASNRKPRRTEVPEGFPALEALMSFFSHKLSIFAVGKVAEDALARWGGAQCAGYIRHPAQGGEGKFRSQFRSHIAARL